MFSCSTCSWESPGCSTVALVQRFMNLSWPLLSWVEVERQTFTLRIHVHLTEKKSSKGEKRWEMIEAPLLQACNNKVKRALSMLLLHSTLFLSKTILILSERVKSWTCFNCDLQSDCLPTTKHKLTATIKILVDGFVWQDWITGRLHKSANQPFRRRDLFTAD